MACDGHLQHRCVGQEADHKLMLAAMLVCFARKAGYYAENLCLALKDAFNATGRQP